MDENIKNILNDLYSVDQNLRQHEKDLIEIIKTLLAARPEAKYDPNFKQELRAQLLAKFEQIKNKESVTNTKINFNNMNKLFYALGGLLLMVIVIMPFVYRDKVQLANINKINVQNGLQVAKLSDHAFGVLSSNSETTAPQRAYGMGAGPAAEENAGYGGGGVAIDKAVSDTTMIAPSYYTYVYDGEEIILDSTKLPVYKKIKGLGAQENLAKILQGINFGNIDLNKFQNTQLRNFQISENKDFGYALFVDLYEGNISINENWEKWPQLQVYNPLKPSDMPDDQTLINMANQFLAEKNINIDQYGEPSVGDDWRLYAARTEQGMDYYIPETVTVLYPQIIDGKVVYDEWGNKFGINVSINIRQNKVSAVYGMTNQNYQTSDYEMETDVSKILKLAEQGGTSPYYIEENAQKIEIKLDTPTYSYIQIWQYDGYSSSQLFVPALVFPIKEVPQADYFYRKSVVIPLAKEMIDQRLNQDYPPSPIMY